MSCRRSPVSSESEGRARSWSTLQLEARFAQGLGGYLLGFIEGLRRHDLKSNVEVTVLVRVAQDRRARASNAQPGAAGRARLHLETSLTGEGLNGRGAAQ